MNTKRRFIAGAICPRCKALDKIVMYRKYDTDFRECVECGFQDESRFQPQSREIQTRVNTSAEQIAEDTQVVRIFDFPPGEESEPRS